MSSPPFHNIQRQADPRNAQAAHAADGNEGGRRGGGRYARFRFRPGNVNTTCTLNARRQNNTRHRRRNNRRPSEQEESIIHTDDGTQRHHSNPAVVGLSGFALTTLLLQLSNLGLCGNGAVVVLGVVVGGLMQLVAGFQEFQTGNTFGYLAFCGYGAFWLAYSSLLLLAKTSLFVLGDREFGWFLVVYTLFTVLLWVASLRLNLALCLTLSALLVGFLLLDLLFLLPAPQLLPGASGVLMASAFGAFYIVAHYLFRDVFQRDLLPLGPSIVK